MDVSPSNRVTLDGSGNGQCAVGPPTGTVWDLNLATLSVSSATSQPQGFLYRGSVQGPLELVDSTYTGAQASSGKVAGPPFYSGQYLWAKWTGGTPGAVATLQAFGVQSPRASRPLGEAAPVGEGFANPIAAGELLLLPSLAIGGVPPAAGVTQIGSGTAIPAGLQAFYTGRGEPLVSAEIFWLNATSYNYIATTSAGVSATTVMGSVNGATVSEYIRFVSNLITLLGAGGPGQDLAVGSGGGGQTVSLLSGVLLEALSGAIQQFDAGSNLSISQGGLWDIDGHDAPRSVAATAILTASSADVTAETVVNSFTMDFIAGRAYSVRFGGRVDCSNASGRPRLRLRKTNIAGAMLWDFGGYTASATAAEDQAVANEAIIVRTAGSDLTNVVVCLTLENLSGGANTTRLVATATNPFWYGAFDVGAASDFSGGHDIT